MKNYGLSQAVAPTGMDSDYGMKMQTAQREQVLIEKMASTANRLEDIESQIIHIKNWLYGPEPTNAQEAGYGSEPNALSQANRAYHSVGRIEKVLEDIYQRLANND